MLKYFLFQWRQQRVLIGREASEAEPIESDIIMFHS